MTANHVIRKLQAGEEIPYALLLFADETRESIDRYIHDSTIYLLNLEGQTDAIAVYALQVVEPGAVEIKNVAVHPSWRGRGYGTLLLQHATQAAREGGFQEIRIGTGTANVAGQQLKLYQREGFEIYEVKKNFFIDNFPEPIYEQGEQLVDMVMLRKKLV